MLTITRRQARDIRAVFRRALGLSSRKAGPAIHFIAGPAGLTIRCHSSASAVEFHQAGEQPECRLSLPFEALADFEARSDDPVALEADGNQVIARWSDGRVPQVRSYDVPADVETEFPPGPATLSDNDSSLPGALKTATDTTDRDATRYALGCLQLRGGTGRIAATDGSQLLVQHGFEFPWDGDRLIPQSKVFGSREFAGVEQVSIGADDDWVTLCVGPWTVWFAIEKEARFPAVDDFIRKPADAPTTLRLSDADAEFLQQSIQQLPSDDALHNPVTVDLNGEVAIRGRASEKDLPTELVLSNSQRTGEPLRFNTNRKFLERAVKLGFREISLYGEEQAVLCHNERCDYIWMALEARDAVPTHPKAVRIASAGAADSPSPSTTERKPPSMPKTSTRRNGQSRAGTNGHSETAAESELSPLKQAEALQETLKLALTQTRALTVELRKRKKQSRLMKSTLASLRELQTVDV